MRKRLTLIIGMFSILWLGTQKSLAFPPDPIGFEKSAVDAEERFIAQDRNFRLLFMAADSISPSETFFRENVATRSHTSVSRQFEYPIAFEIKASQTALGVEVIGHGPTHRIFLASTDAFFASSAHSKRAPCALDSLQSDAWLTPSVAQASCARTLGMNLVQLRLLGANTDTSPEGREMLSSYSNYLIGNDPRKWRGYVPQFAEVWYRSIYPGIDLVYYGNEGHLEYDFIVTPCANPRRIKFSIGGSGSRSHVHLNTEGDLVIPSDEGDILFHRPTLHQGRSCNRKKASHFEDEPGCTTLAGGKFRLQRMAKGDDIVSFELPSYDHTQPLIIDPAVVFSTFFGGSNGDGVDSLTVDSAGNIYLYGDTNSPDFPVTSGAYQKNLAGDVDAFVTKLTPDGSQILWSTYLGGSKAEYPKGIGIDSANNVYVTGQTWSTDFPVVNAFQPQSHSYSTGYVSKLSADGSKLIWSTYLGGSSQDTPHGIGLDTQGEVVVVGTTDSLDFPMVNAIQPSHGTNGYANAFITKFSADGSSLIFSTYFGGNSFNEAAAVALDPSGNIYLTGDANAGFTITPNAFETTCVHSPCVFVSKLSASGQDLAYSTYLDNGLGYGIAVNSAGNAFITGQASVFFPVTQGAFQTVQGGGSSADAFVTELDATGSSLVYSTFLGGNNNDYGWAIAVDSSNNAFVTGQTDSPNFPLQSPLQTTFYPGVPSVFVSELNNTGSALVFSTYWGGGVNGYGSQQGNAIAVDSAGNIIAAGSTLVPDFPVINPIQSQLLGPGDAFVTKFEFASDFGLAGSPTTATVSAGQAAKYLLTLTPLNGFNQQVSLTCSGAPSGATCSISPSTLTLDGVNPAQATVTVTTTPRTESALGTVSGGTLLRPRGASERSSAVLVVFAGTALGLLSLVGRRQPVLVFALFVFGAVFCVSCSGGGGSNGGSGGTPVGTYTIKTEATGGNINRNATFTLDVL